jgi:S1-C subfamily serine protease
MDENEERFILGDLVEPVVIDTTVDLAILRTNRAFAPALTLSRKAPVVGDPIQMLGYPLGFNSIFHTRGWVANLAFKERDYSKTFMVYQVVGAPGNSGSPILNEKGELVSVLQFGWSADHQTFGPIAGGVTYETLKHFVIGYF